ncbi:MAG TPA: CDP-diacylglycerol--serine O-phosphatidyltransferase [Gemmatimonadaceae bacterium]|nr:CDP-diacylglycerol--serine O-phosphatidyltransferase [Gemmatimonadaceae bacterium]
MRQMIVILPNGLTLLNLFFGIWAIVAASRDNYNQASLLIVLGAIADALDGRIARATKTGSRFGEELDSLVDAISFGLAPALIMYFAVLRREGWAWMFVFLFTACAVMRLARFNVEHAGRKKTHFHGLPSPSAGMTLATYLWFSQTSLYQQTVIGNLPWESIIPWIMVGLSFLMISSVPYPAVPTISFRSLRGIVGSAIIIGTIVGLIVLPREFFFPALMGYVLYGIIKAFLVGLMERLPSDDVLLEEEDDEEEDGFSAPEFAVEEPDPGRRRRRRRGRRRSSDPPPKNRAVEEDGT